MVNEGNMYASGDLQVERGIGCLPVLCVQACLVNICSFHVCFGDACFINSI